MGLLLSATSGIFGISGNEDVYVHMPVSVCTCVCVHMCVYPKKGMSCREVGKQTGSRTLLNNSPILG